MARRVEKVIERVALTLFICAGIAAYVASHFALASLGTIASPLAASWAIAMFLLAVPHGLRFGEGALGILGVGLVLATVFVIPLLPHATIAGPPEGVRLFFFVTLVVLLQMGMVVAWGFRNQGRHFYTDRELPELEGEPRDAAEEVLLKAGLRPVSLRVIPLGAPNAFVLGLKSCVVALDPSVGKLLDREEIQALVAHEAGHVRAGGMFAGIGPIALTLAGANTAALLGWISEVDVFACIGAFLCLRSFTSQLLELHCDRFAVRLTSLAAAASMLRKVH